MIEVITFQDWRKMDIDSDDVVVTVSKAKGWSQGLSPFILGPCEMWGGHVAKNVENAWQFSKMYTEDYDEWLAWASKGWNDSYAHRYPMGKGAIPLWSYWDKEKLTYIEARKRIYIPLYYKAVKDTAAFAELEKRYKKNLKLGRNLYLIDFDAYRHNSLGMTYKDVIESQAHKMGHAFVLAMMLEAKEQLERTLRNKGLI